MDSQEILVMHRHWIWANIFKQHFDQELASSISDPTNIADRHGAYMLVWYSMLFSVLESFRRLGVEFNEIKDNIEVIYEPLKRLRNAVFHPQPSYWPNKLLRFLKIPDSPQRIRRIHSFLGKYFLAQIESISHKKGT